MFVYLLIFPLSRSGRVQNSVFVKLHAGICAAACSDALSPKIEIAVFQFQSSYAHSLTSALHCLVPVRPRRQIVYPLEKLGINAPSKAVSKEPVGSRAAAGREARCQLLRAWQMGWQHCLRGSRLLLNYREPGAHALTGAPCRGSPAALSLRWLFYSKPKTEAVWSLGWQSPGDAFLCCCVSGQVAWSQPLESKEPSFFFLFPQKQIPPFHWCFTFKAKVIIQDSDKGLGENKAGCIWDVWVPSPQLAC